MRKIGGDIFFAACIAALPVGTLGATTATAATITVTTLEDTGPGSIQEAISIANPGDTIDFDVSGTIRLLTSTLYINKDLTIKGPGPSNLAISGRKSRTVFHIDRDSHVTISGLTIKEGYTGGVRSHGYVTFDNCHITNSSTGIENHGDMNISNSNISYNSKRGVVNYPWDQGTDPPYHANLIIRNSIISFNYSDDPQCYLAEGGGIYNVTGSVFISDTRISNNFSCSGAGILSKTGEVIIKKCIISYNEIDADYESNLVFRGGGTFSISDSTISNNKGKGILVENVTGTIISSSISGNFYASGGGGGIHVYGPSTKLTVLSSTIANNSTEYGGGIFAGGGARLKIINSTIVGNVATANNIWGGDGGGIKNSFSSALIELSNTIVAGNTANLSPNCHGMLTTLNNGHNLYGDLSGCTIEGSMPGDFMNADPLLGAFRDNGTPGNGHFPLLAGSPAIDRGDDGQCPAMDQLGTPRFDAYGIGAARCDIGAVEYTGPPLPDEVPVSKAIIVAGYGPHPTNWLWNETVLNAAMAYKALLLQGYEKKNIMLLSAANFDADGNGKFDDVTNDATNDNLKNAIASWPVDPRSPAKDLLLYMIDHGANEEFEMKYSDTVHERLHAGELAAWLNDMQPRMPGKLIVIYDACRSGSFLGPLRIPANSNLERIVVTSSAAAEKAKFVHGGRLSFSYQFWTAIAEGAPLVQAFRHGRDMMYAQRQNAWLDSNGNAIPNEHNDYSPETVIGKGEKSAIVRPIIDETSSPGILHGETFATLWATVAGTRNIRQLLAVIIPPEYDPEAPDMPQELPTVSLEYSLENNRYEVGYNGFTKYGEYKVVFYAEDEEGNFSFPRTTTIFQENGPDIHEDDNSAGQAGVIVLNDGTPRTHTFHVSDDADWITFYGVAGESYVVEADISDNTEKMVDMVIELYAADGSTMIAREDKTCDPFDDEYLDWLCGEDGIYYVKFWNRIGSSGISPAYQVRLKRPFAPAQGTLTGFIRDAMTDAPIGDAVIRSSEGGSAVSRKTGQYELTEMAGPVKLAVTAGGYAPLCNNIVMIYEAKTANLDFFLGPNRPEILAGKFGKTDDQGLVAGDYDCDGDVDGMDLAMSARAMQ